uniref:ARAD1D01232p n=1 Tax=Blastobotrys adeninivorans TaxID=409370 RepID=A0A060T779_BLAAD
MSDENDDEHQIWLSNKDKLYETMYNQKMKVAAMTFQWLPGSTIEKNVVQQKFVTGTYDEDEIYLKVGQFDGPLGTSEVSGDDNKPKSRYILEIPHSGDVNRARYCPKKPNLVATINDKGLVQVFDTNKTAKDCLVKTLRHHNQNGFGLAFAGSTSTLASAADDGTIALWEIDGEGETPITKLNVDFGVNDVKFKKTAQNVFGIVTESKTLAAYDSRGAAPIFEVKDAHDDAINSLDFHPKSSHLLATASHDNTVALWDDRFLSHKLHSLMGHSAEVTSVEWSPFNDNVLASGSDDKRVLLWDISKIGQEQAPDDIEDGAPEVLFMHGGHIHSVNEFNWNPEHNWTIGSVSGDLTMQIWRPKDAIVNAGKELRGMSSINDSELE